MAVRRYSFIRHAGTPIAARVTLGNPHTRGRAWGEGETLQYIVCVLVTATSHKPRATCSGPLTPCSGSSFGFGVDRLS
mgnify:CR=1 FL=1